MASHSGPILVTAASGKTGRRCVDKLVARGANVRAMARRPEAAAELMAAGAREVALGDLTDREALRSAVRGVSRILHICPPMHPQEDEIAATLTQLALSEGVERLALYSVMHPHIDVPHHRRKLRAETQLIQSGLCFTIMQPCRYMQHLLPIWSETLRERAHRMPFSTQARFSLAHLDDLAEACATVLTQDGHDYAIYELGGPEALSQEDCARVISDVVGYEIRAEAKPRDVYLAQARAAGMPDARIETLDIMNRHYDAHGLQGNGNVLRWLLGRAPITFRVFVEDLAARR